MKKFIVFFLMAIIVCSCGSIKTTTETYYGRVTTFTPQGDTLQTWDNALIEEKTTMVSTMYGTTSTSESAFKAFGLNFIDRNTGDGVIVHKNIPYIIEYKTDVTTNDSVNTNNIADETLIKANELETKHSNCRFQIAENKKAIKNLDKKSDEYRIKKEQNDKLRGKMRELENEYLKLTGNNMYGYYGGY